MRRLVPLIQASRVRVLSLLLIGGLFGPWLRAQTPLPAGQITPEVLSRFCAAQNITECAVPLRGQYTLALHGEWQLPRSMHLHFGAGSVLHIGGGTLEFQGGSVEVAEAPADNTVFPDGDHIRGLAAARPEWFSAAAGVLVPASALAAAYRATEPWGTIYLQSRAYVSPFGGCPAVADSLRYLSPRTLVGSGRAVPDDLLHPTHLQAGTILLGGIMGSAPVRAAHLGIDTGPRVSAGLMRGCELPAVFIEQPASREFVTGDRLEDVSVLTTNGDNMHSVMLAGHDGAQVRDLWIWTLGGTHGLVMKSSNSLVDGLHCFGAGADCLIVKSDYATDFLGRAVHDRVAHVDIRPLQPGGTVGGIVVDSSWDSVRSLDMEDISETGTLIGINIFGSALYRPQGITIRNWSADRVSESCLTASRVDMLKVLHFRCAMLPSALAGVILVKGRDALLQDGVIGCAGDANACAASHTDGVRDEAEGTSLLQIGTQGLGGYLLRGTQPAPPQELRSVEGMGERTFAPPSTTRSLRRQMELSDAVLAFRILYIAVRTRVLLHLLSAQIVAVLLLLGGGLLLFRLWRRLQLT